MKDTYTHKELKKYVSLHVTGIDRAGKRFKFEYDTTNGGIMTAFGINLWSGSVWGVKPNGKRKLLKRV